MAIIGKVAVHRSGKARHQSMEAFQGTEIKLDLEPSFVQLLLPFGHDPLHGFERSNEEPSFPFTAHILLKLCRDISGIEHNDAVSVFVNRPADISIIRGRKREDDAEDSSVMITGHRHFEPVKPAL